MDRILIHGYLNRWCRPEQVVHFFRHVLGLAVVDKEVLSQRTLDYQAWGEAYVGNHRNPIQWAQIVSIRPHPSRAFSMITEVLPNIKTTFRPDYVRSDELKLCLMPTPSHEGVLLENDDLERLTSGRR